MTSRGPMTAVNSARSVACSPSTRVQLPLLHAKLQSTSTRDCASQRVHTSQRESIGRAPFADTTDALAAHDSYAPQEHIITRSHRDSNYSLRLTIADSALRLRRLTRTSLRSTAHLDSSTATISITREAPPSHSIPIAAVSANTVSPPMDPCDAASIFGSAAFGFCDFRAACEVLRSCDETELTIRGIDAQFRREIAATGSNSIRDLLRAHFARLPEMLRALSEFSIIECREDVPALTLTSSGRREDHRVLPRTRSFLLRGTHRR